MSPAKPNPPAMTPEKLKGIIEVAGITVTEAANRLKIRRETLHRWLNGNTPISRANAALIRETFLRK